MFYFLILVLGVALLLYAILGGADFGAGILELFKGKKRRRDQEKLITKAMGPVWEANNIWLIIAVVILFNAFPPLFAQFSIYFHIPLTIMLIGIIFRGCAFTFRHYDAYQDRSERLYSLVFAVSSVLSPLAIGAILGGALLGKCIPINEGSFWEVFIAPWLNSFGIAVGIFVCSLFAFIASAFLIIESPDQELEEIFRIRAKASNLFCLLSGGLVFIFAQVEGLSLIAEFIANPLSLACVVLATFTLYPLWKYLDSQHKGFVRFFASTQVALVLIGYFGLIYPDLMKLEGGETFFSAAAPETTLYYLTLCLIIGLVLVIPALAYLLYIFKLGVKNES